MAEISSDTARLAIVLGAVLPGIGHLYIGKIRRGVYVILILLFTGTVSSALYATFTNIINAPGNSRLEDFSPPFGVIFITNIIGPSLALIPLIAWVLQIRDLRKIIKKKIGRTIDELEPPHSEIKASNPNDGTVCSGCGRYINRESKVCNNCGLLNL